MENWLLQWPRSGLSLGQRRKIALGVNRGNSGLFTIVSTQAALVGALALLSRLIAKDRDRVLHEGDDTRRANSLTL